jgi:thioesterase domain-containing protein
MEMAAQLATLGHEVPTVLLIEASAPTAELTKNIEQHMGALDEERMAYLYVNNFGRCFGVDLGLDRSHFANLSSSEIAQAALRELRRVPQFPPDVDTARLASYLAVFNATGYGFRRWHPARRYPGRVIHFLASGGHPDFGQGTGRLDWTEFSERPIETIPVPGDHFSVVNEPHVAALGAALDRVLETLP